ncbi:MAG TPA: hypothetical protein VG297_01110 [Bryobacteraceae bacterium]|nr:hypothetical protein [Bryobacteraceae bacterium]
MFNRIRVEKERHSRMWTLVLCGLAGFSLALPGTAKDAVMTPVAAIDVETTVGALRQVTAGPLAGLHLDANIKGRVMDIYVAPMDFAAKYVARLSKGDYVHIVGTQVKSGESDVVLAREITTGSIDRKTGTFHEDMSTYLWNDAGPLWE